MKHIQGDKSLLQEAATCTTREAADMLGISLRTAQLWVEQEVLEAWKTPGGHRRISRASVDALARGEGGPRQGSLRQGGARPFNVLLVEDDPDLRALYLTSIAGWNMPLVLADAANGFEGLLKIGANPPDLLITDVDMPEVDGLQMIRVIDKALATRRPRIIVVTALADTEISRRGGLPPDVTLMRKPLALDQLHGYLQACMATRPGASGTVLASVINK